VSGILKGLLLKHEGMRTKPYRDTVGKLTIGVGRNLDDVGISDEEALYLLENDIARAKQAADEELVWFEALDPVRQDVVLSMIFQLGLAGFRKFRRFKRAMDRNDYAMASKEMLESDWAKQVPKRAEELAEMMRTGRYA
jgi:lysozyme